MVSDTVQRVPLQLTRGCVVASVQVDLEEAVLRRFQADLLQYVQATSAVGVIIDLSGVEIMDTDDWEALRRTLAMAKLMGARSVVAGLRPGVVAALIELGADGEGIETAHSLDEGLDLFAEATTIGDEEPAEADHWDTDDDAAEGDCTDVMLDGGERGDDSYSYRE
jgi:rsbT antagonist protein RsbS